MMLTFSEDFTIHLTCSSPELTKTYPIHSSNSDTSPPFDDLRSLKSTFFFLLLLILGSIVLSYRAYLYSIKSRSIQYDEEEQEDDDDMKDDEKAAALVAQLLTSYARKLSRDFS